MARYATSSGARLRTGAGLRLQAQAAARLLLAQLARPCALALSTRQLAAGAQPCVRLRRSSDGAERDIGYGPDGILDSQAALAFCGPGDGFVARWHDNADPARFAVQADPGRQPRLVAAGAMHAIGGKPALSWPSSRSARMDFALSGVADQFMGFVATSNAAPTDKYGARLLSYTAAGDDNDYSTPNSFDAMDIRYGRTLSFYIGNAFNPNPSAPFPAGPQLCSAFVDGAQGTIRVRGGGQASAPTSGPFGPEGTLIIGNNYGNENYIGLIADVIVQTSVSASDLDLIEASAAACYGIA